MLSDRAHRAASSPPAPHVRRATWVGMLLHRVMRRHSGVQERRMRRRARLILLSAGWLLIVIGSLWFLVYASLWHVPGMLCLGAVACMGTAVTALARRGHFLWSGLLLHLGAMLMLSIVCLWFDVPRGDVPRAAHLYFPTLATIAYFIYEDEHDWLSWVMITANATLFVVFAASNVAFHTPLALPLAVQSMGTWVNATAAVITLAVTLIVVHVRAVEDGELLSDLRTAIAHEQFELFYQPIVDPEGRLVGAEGLLRWHHPRHGLLAPERFIGLAESTGLVVHLGEWVLRRACTDLAEWQHQPQLCGLRLSINLSAAQLLDSRFGPELLDLLARSGAPASRLRLELTETTLLRVTEQTLGAMRSLGSHGISFSLDDFGTGYSSLSCLHEMPVHGIKIDQCFVRGLGRQTQTMIAIPQTLLALGRSLHLDVVAEGVERHDQWRLLRNEGCRLFQGFLFSQPVERTTFLALALQKTLAHPQPGAGSSASASMQRRVRRRRRGAASLAASRISTWRSPPT